VRRLLHLGWVLLGLLVIECIVGIGLAMYVSLPSSPSFMTVFVSIPLLTVHVALAFLLVVVAAYAAGLAFRLHVRGVALVGALSTLFLLFALEEGFAFTFTSNNMYSVGMVLGFLGSLVLQLFVLVRLRRTARSAATPSAASTAAGAP
jgi:hypothetical protein